MATTYTVKKGDTLWGIATTYASTISGSNTSAKVQTLVKLNDITDPDYIVVGQVLQLDGSEPSPATNNTSKAKIKVFGLQSNADRTIYATWTWTKTNTDKYQTIWYYDTGDGVWFIGNDSTTTKNQSLYTAPSNAKRVKFKVKPISKTHKVNKKDVSYWIASWSTEESYSFSNNPPKTPSKPTVKIEQYTLTATLENIDSNSSLIQFQVVKNNSKVFKTGSINVTTSYASFSCKVAAGGEYKVRCRAYGGGEYSAWSDYSSNVETAPAAPNSITVCKANSKTSIYLEWEASSTAKSYTIEYATKKSYLEGSNQTSTVSDIKFTKYELGGLESGQEYFLRVKAVNDKGDSSWTSIVSVVIGTEPSAPTTWSSVTTIITGDNLTLYWVHNSEDGSSQTFAELELYIDNVKETHTITNSTDEDEKDKTSSYVIDTSSYIEGTKIQWRVRTAGITKVYGDWSVQRTVDVYAPPTLELDVTDSEGAAVETLELFPFYVSCLAGPNTQVPIGYHLTVTSKQFYETVDDIGNTKVINEGDEVYSKYFDTSEPLLVELSANNINLENNVTYTITCVVSMDSGLTATSSSDFTVAWTDMEYEPNAEIGIDEITLVSYIRPFCANANGTRIPDITLSVYRREFDGTFTELATNLDNTKNIFITDPHPSLDYARYRIVAKSTTTGAISFYDVPGYPVGEVSAVIQWDEEWSTFDTTNEDLLENPPWSGSLLKLPYNLDVSDKYSNDVELVKYTGRDHPVSYYGTQVGETSTWKIQIDKQDKETLYALRRLAICKQDVYVREPSGSGYWANVSVSFSQTHKKVVIPVTLTIKRVEGGA